MPSQSPRKSFYFVRPPKVVRWAYSSAKWRVPVQEPTIYLTFDDGPDPDVTPQILDMLAQFQAKATFFVIGEQAIRQPDLVREIIERGHGLGSHGMTHLNGRKTSLADYLSDVGLAHSQLSNEFGVNWRGFRPPFGKITRPQWQALKENFEVVMWDLMPGDFDPKISNQQFLHRLKLLSRPGSIIVLHDSQAGWDKLKNTLPEYLETFIRKNWQFSALPDSFKVK